MPCERVTSTQSRANALLPAMQPSGSTRPTVVGAVIAAGLVSLLAAATTSASLFLILKPTSGLPGTEVAGRTSGSRAFAAQVEPLRTFLVTRTAADSVTSPNDARLVGIGRLVIDAAGVGRISFLVPEVDPGDYTVVVFCPSCAPFSAGRTMLPVADFTVTSGSPSTDTVPLATSSTRIHVGALLLAVAAALAALRWRLSR